MNAVMSSSASPETSNGLYWLRGELERSLTRIREQIDHYLEHRDDPLPLQRTIVDLHQVRGIATVVQCYGAGWLAEAMKTAVQALIDGKSRDEEAAVTALLGASVQLGDYLDLLATGERDALLVFHPMVNELRVACGAGVLSESDFVARHVTDSGMLEWEAAVGDASAQTAARKLLPALHSAMRKWIRGNERIDSLKRIGRIAEHLHGQTQHAELALLMQATAATVEALLALKLTDSLDVKRLMGRMGELVKAVAMHGEAEADPQAMIGIGVRMGVAVHRSEARSRRARALAQRLSLDELLVPDAELERLRSRIRGPNTEVLTRVTAEIREDFALVKDEIDLAIRTRQRTPEQYETMAGTLKRVSDTLSMLDLGALQRVIDRQIDILDTLDLSADEQRWMDLATALLTVEHNLEDALFGHVRSGGRRQDPADVLASPPPIKLDHREGAAAALRESLVNLSTLKEHASDYIARGEPGLLADAKRLLHQVQSALTVLESDRGADLIAQLREIMDLEGFRKIRDSADMADQFADAVALAECYLEALQQAQPRTEHLLDQLEQRLEAVSGSTHEAAVRPEPEAGEIAIPEPVDPTSIDPEIREVFLEEAGEVLATLEGHLPKFLRNTDDTETLTVMRRAFHTLKGSGRMVGANDIGEFGWAIEHMLNRCLEGALAITPALTETVEQAVSALPGVIDNFRNGEALSDAGRALVARADRVARGLPVDADGGDDDIDPEIHRIFREDARQHLDTIRAWLDTSPNEHGRFRVTRDLERALHTVTGSAAALSLDDVSDLAGELENLCATVRAAEMGLDDAGRALIYDAMTELTAWLDADESGAAARPDLESLKRRARDAMQALPEDVLAASAQRRLVITFTDEAAELLDVIEQEARAWQATPTATPHGRRMAEALHTIKGSADMAGFTDVKEQAKALRESILATSAPDADTPDARWFGEINAGIERIYQQLDAYRSGVQMDESPSDGMFPQDLPEVGEGQGEADEGAAQPSADVTEPESPLDAGESFLLESADDGAEVPGDSEAATLPADQSSEIADATDAADEPEADSAQFDDELAAIFADEGQELLQAIDQAFSRFEEQPDDNAPLDEMARVLHTLKGGARTAGVVPLGDASHRLEDVVVAMQAGRLARDASAISQLHNIVDGLHGMVDALGRGEIDAGRQVLDDIDDLQSSASGESATEAVSPPLQDEPQTGEADSDVAEPSEVADAGIDADIDTDTDADDGDGDGDGVDTASLAAFDAAIDTPADDVVSAPLDATETPADDLVGMSVDATDVSEVVSDEAPTEPASAGVDTPVDPPEPETVPTVVVDTDEALDPEMVEIFAGEARELVEEMQQTLSGLLEDTDRQPPAIATIRRCLHTLKGGARVTGLTALGDAAHDLETDLESVLASRQFTPQWLRDAEAGVERLAAMVDDLERGLDAATPAAGATAESVVEPVVDEPPLAVQPTEITDEQPPAAPVAQPPVDEADDEALTADLSPAAEPSSESPDALAADVMPAGLDDPAQQVGDDGSMPAADVDAAPPAVATHADTAVWDERLFWAPAADEHERAAVRRETARVTVEQLETMLNQAGEVGIYHSRLEQQASALANQLVELSQTIERVRGQMRQMELETEAQIQARQAGMSDSDPDHRYGDEFDPLEMDRYTRMQELSRALDESVADLANLHETLSDQVGEADTMLRHQGQTNTAVQQGLMSTLMVPFSRQVQRLQRVVRQTAAEVGREVTAEFEGIESEMDRNVLERMTAPLEHLMRNAVFHGIEPPEDRAAAGKPETGRIDVKLRREGTQLIMEIADDGRGLNLDAIRRKAVDAGMLSPQAEPSDEAIAQFIFQPGFSTAETLTQSAGRGVGMDVVAAEVKQLGGTVDVRSEAGHGVRFLIRLPLSLAISQALLMTVHAETYAVPIGGVDGIARIATDQLADAVASDEPSFEYGGNRYAVRYFGSLVGLNTPETFETRNLPVVLTSYTEGLGGEQRRVALAVDQLLGRREIVSKQAGPQVGAIDGIAGATIMPDGEVVLILDLGGLLRAEAQHRVADEVAMPAAPVGQAPVHTQPVIMVVDDSITMRRVAERLLTRNGYAVVTAKDGMDAMAQLADARPDAMLLDIEMPRVDGFEVATFVRNTEELSDVPIVMITSRSGDKHRDRAEKIGVNRYLIKPYQEADLLGALDELLGERAVHHG